MWNNIKVENIVYLVIDMQDKFYPLIPKAILDDVKKNVMITLKMCNELSIPTIGSEHYVKGLGHTDEDINAIWQGEPFKDKITFSCIKNDLIYKELKNYSRKVVVVSGLETHICVLQSVLDLIKENYQVIVLKDTCVSSTKLKWENGISLMEKAGAQIMNMETFLFYLLQRVDKKEFKTLVKLLKNAQDN